MGGAEMHWHRPEGFAWHCPMLSLSGCLPNPLLNALNSWKTGTWKTPFWIHHGAQPGPGTEEALSKCLLTHGLMEEKKEGEEKEEGREGRRNLNTKPSRQGANRKKYIKNPHVAMHLTHGKPSHLWNHLQALLVNFLKYLQCPQYNEISLRQIN